VLTVNYFGLTGNNAISTNISHSAFNKLSFTGKKNLSKLAGMGSDEARKKLYILVSNYQYARTRRTDKPTVPFGPSLTLPL
jgi:hypothetical protein